MELSPRLLKIASLVPDGARLADVGTDHGYIPLYLFENKIISSAIAMDVNKGPLLHANENIKKYGLEKNIETRLSNGLLLPLRVERPRRTASSTGFPATQTALRWPGAQ